MFGGDHRRRTVTADMLPTVRTEHGPLRQSCTVNFAPRCSRANLGTAATAFWKQDYVAVAPGEMTLRRILGDSRLAQQLPEAPSEPHPLTQQQVREIHTRCATGEPSARVAEAYKTDIATVDRIKRLAR